MAMGRYRHIVFDANADALPASFDLRLAIWHRQPIAHVEARLHGEHHARLQLHVVLTEAIGPHIVYIKAKPVAGAVHVEVAVGPLLDHPVKGSCQQP